METTVGRHPLVQRLIKGVFQTRPSLPRYKSTWDTSQVLNYLKTLPDYQNITLRNLSLKLVMLCALLTGQRCQTLFLMNLDHMTKTTSSYRFAIDSLVKQSKPGKAQPVLELRKFPGEPKLCAFSAVEQYILRTESLRNNESQLFISCINPYGKVSKDTISRWIRKVMQLSGIDTEMYKPHSTRAASTSKAKQCNVPISDIMGSASWSTDSTFHRFYDRHINTPEPNIFGHAILLDATSSQM